MDKNTISSSLAEVGVLFRLPGEFIGYECINNGNINRTYRVDYDVDGTIKSYMFQKVNTNVFKDPVAIMDNIDKVTTYIRDNAVCPDDKPTLHFHHLENGDNYVFDHSNCFWRVMNYVDSITFNVCDNLKLIESTGKAFGCFQMELADFDGTLLKEIIPDFHNTKKRLDTLFDHVNEDPEGRVPEVKDEIGYISSVREKACKLCDEFEKGDIPVRVTHNDTKSNNVLYDKVSFEPLVVIDLDTVMPGMAMYDFGDAVRFACNDANEDEKDLSKVFFNEAKFKAFCKGYLGQVSGSLTDKEIDSLVLGAFSVTIELASRFLDDYITGDKYFKTEYEGHNLVRTRCQLHLARDIQNKYKKLNDIVRSVINDS